MKKKFLKISVEEVEIPNYIGKQFFFREDGGIMQTVKKQQILENGAVLIDTGVNYWVKPENVFFVAE